LRATTRSEMKRPSIKVSRRRSTSDTALAVMLSVVENERLSRRDDCSRRKRKKHFRSADSRIKEAVMTDVKTWINAHLPKA